MRQPPQQRSLDELYRASMGLAEDDVPLTQPSRRSLAELYEEEERKQQQPAQTAPASAPPSAPAQSEMSTGDLMKGRARALGQGAMLGFSDEAEALARSLMPGTTYEQAKQQIAQEMGQYRSERPMESLALEVGGGLLTGGAGGARALAATGLRRGAAKLATSAAGQGFLSGVGAAEGDAEQRLKGGLVGGSIGAALPFGISKIGQKLGTANITQPLRAWYTSLQDMLATGAERVGLPSGMIAPTTGPRIQRAAAEVLPGSTTGRTAGELLDEARQQSRGLRARTEQARETGRARVAGLREAASESRQLAEDITGEAGREARRTITASRAQAKQAAEDVMTQVRGEAERTLGGMQVPRGSARELQEQVRATQLAEGDRTYQLVREIGPPPEVDPEIYREILKDPALRAAYRKSVGDISEEALTARPGTPVLARPGTVSVDGIEMPELTLETMDLIRRRVLDPTFRVSDNATGLTASQRRATLNQINRVEDRFLAGYGTDEAAQTLRNARGAYREKFAIMEAIQDGLGLGTAKAGRPSGLLKQSAKELDEVERRVAAMTEEQREAFQVGAREWFNRTIQESPKEAYEIAQKHIGSESGRRKLAMAYGDEAVAALRAFAPDVVGARKGAAAGQVRREAQELAGAMTESAALRRAPVEARAARAESLAERAREQTRERVQALRGERRAVVEQAGPLRTLRGALGDSEKQQQFLRQAYPGMTPAQRDQATEVLGSNVQRRLQDLARSNATPQQMLEEVNKLKQNDVVRTLFGADMDQFVNTLYPSFASRLPGAVRPAASGQLARVVSGNFFGDR